MTLGRLVRVTGYYNDASYLERIIASFRKLLIDIDWIHGRRITEEGLYEVYLYVRDHPNLKHAILNLSKTVGIEKVEVFKDFDVKVIGMNAGNAKANTDKKDGKTVFVLYVPIYSQAVTYSWGEKYGENLS